MAMCGQAAGAPSAEPIPWDPHTTRDEHKEQVIRSQTLSQLLDGNCSLQSLWVREVVLGTFDDLDLALWLQQHLPGQVREAITPLTCAPTQAARLSVSRETGLVHQRRMVSDQDREVTFAECLFPRAGEAAHPAQEMACVTGATRM